MRKFGWIGFLTKERAEKMRKFGWGGTLFLMGLAVAAAAVPANAGFVLSLSSAASATGVNPGESFVVSADMTGLPEDMFDVHNWTVSVGEKNLGENNGERALIYNGYVYNAAEFSLTDDNSSPKMPFTGLLINNGLFAATSTIADVKFEGLTLANPDGTSNPFIGSGNMLTMQLQMPGNAQIGETYDLVAAPRGVFNLGFDDVVVGASNTLRINVTPEPATLVLLGLGGVAAVRRRFLGA